MTEPKAKPAAAELDTNTENFFADLEAIRLSLSPRVTLPDQDDSGELVQRIARMLPEEDPPAGSSENPADGMGEDFPF